MGILVPRPMAQLGRPSIVGIPEMRRHLPRPSRPQVCQCPLHRQNGAVGLGRGGQENGRLGERYNIGGHNEMKNIDIVKIICKELGKPESLITYVADRKGHDMRYAIDPTKIHNELGWLPETKFADGIKKTIRWYLDNKEWWETIISGEYQNYYEKMYGNR